MTSLLSFCLRVATSSVFLWDANVSVEVPVTRKQIQYETSHALYYNVQLF